MRRISLKWIWTPVAVLLALSLGLVSCEKTPPADKAPDISVSQTMLGPGNTQFTVVIKKAEGTWTSSVEYLSGEDAWITAKSPESGSVHGMVMYEAAVNPVEEQRSARIVVSSSAGSASVTVTQMAAGSEVPSGKAGKWLEMPETPADAGFLFGAHDMNGDPYVSRTVSGIRNWSCWWSPSEHLSMWVAYPLNSGLKGSGNRTEAWGLFDPCFPKEDQPDCAYTYGGGWTRGHQIPSADRLRYNGSQKCNESTFYPTNMTPQEYDFNSNIWANLEGAVRTYSSKCDTLYVVTGCDLKAGAYGWSGGNTGFSVKAPGAYWKAVVAYKKSSQLGFFGSSSDGYFCGCAFYLPHDKSIAYGNYLDYMMSIDNLEKKLGVDLFVNLPDKIGADKAASVESADPISFWK